MTKQLRKGAFFTDIHFGKKSNSPVHNEDCLRFIDWFVGEVHRDPEIDYVGFLGDWNENRSSINLATLTYSYNGAKRLNEIGLPVYFVVGNHDLYHRHTREIFSVLPFQEFANFRLIDQPTIVPEIGDGAFLSPYLFHDEYNHLEQMLKIPFWAGHFEFKGFRITNYGTPMQHGPDPSKFKGPEHILSGHFHQRQQSGNIVYIGNAFPMDFGDAGDRARGMAIYDHRIRDVTFKDWDQAPLYIRCRVSKLLDDAVDIRNQSRVKCILDEELSLEEANQIRDAYVKKYDLREFLFEEHHGTLDGITDTETEVDVPEMEQTSDHNTIDGLIVQMLNDIKVDTIDNDLLIKQYQRLQ